MIEFIVIENRCSKEEITKVKKAVLLAQDKREESWSAKDEVYKIRNITAASGACDIIGLDDFWKPIISHWNEFNWNDIQSWAENKEN